MGASSARERRDPSVPTQRRPRDRAGEFDGRSPANRYDAWGRSESIDPDNVGDIADEGMGHRG
jgi:hypothetical protein